MRQKKVFELISRDIKHGLNHTFIGAGLNTFRIGTLPQHKAQCSEDNRLSGSRFTGHDRKALVKADMEFVYQDEVSYKKRLKHRLISK